MRLARAILSRGRPPGEADLPWEAAARERLMRVPFFVRSLVKKKVEERVRDAGGDRVGLSDFEAAEARFRQIRGNKSDAELETMLPQDNRPGVSTVILETCQNKLSHCPNVLQDTDRLQEMVESCLTDLDASERLRRRIEDEQVLYHHKLRLAVAGCPNGCSRPQIADFGLISYVVPAFDAELCTACGACAEACPDQALIVEDGPPLWDAARCQGCTKCRDACQSGAVSLGAPGVRLLVGGKLGRHPHLAEPVMQGPDMDQVRDRISGLIEQFLTQAQPGERFADFYLRAREGSAS